MVGIRSAGVAPHRGELIEALRHQRLLIALDGCEHVVDDFADLAAVVLAGCPKVQLLVASRERLDVVGR
jgi:predicted ATPase